MRIKKTKVMLFALAAGLSLFALSSAKAQNPNYAPGDLVLAFQLEGGSNTVYVSLGNAATLYRGTSTGADVANAINILNINAELTAAFGANWATNVDLYAGLSGVQSSSANTTAMTNGDPRRTLYVSQSRNGVGNVGQANSAGYAGFGDTAMSDAASGMVAQNNILETTYMTQVAISPNGVSRIDDQNPFLAANLQGNAFNETFAGGVQQVGSAASFGTLGPVANVEFALDLYRIQAVNTIVGQVGEGQAIGQGTYEGTIVVDNLGNVSFVSAVPEPSSCLLLAGGLTALMVFRRRQARNA